MIFSSLPQKIPHTHIQTTNTHIYLSKDIPGTPRVTVRNHTCKGDLPMALKRLTQPLLRRLEGQIANVELPILVVKKTHTHECLNEYDRSKCVCVYMCVFYIPH